jgi:hypothetical protein
MFTHFERYFALAGITLASMLVLDQAARASTNCEITQCRRGGGVVACWSAMNREAAVKRKSCDKIVIGSGSSSYAMAMSIPGTCIKPTAVIRIHRPYTRSNFRQVPVGSHWHNYYFNKVRSSAFNYFRAQGGLNKSGRDNAYNMTSVPASRTGVPICRV